MRLDDERKEEWAHKDSNLEPTGLRFESWSAMKMVKNKVVICSTKKSLPIVDIYKVV